MRFSMDFIFKIEAKKKSIYMGGIKLNIITFFMNS